MNIVKVNNDFAVSSQINIDSIYDVNSNNYKSIICNRPDEEITAEFNEIKALYQIITNEKLADKKLNHYQVIKDTANSLNIKTYYQPINTLQLNKDNILLFAKYLDELDKPILAYCRSGTRCMILWGLVQILVYGADIIQISEQAKVLNYDIQKQLMYFVSKLIGMVDIRD